MPRQALDQTGSVPLYQQLKETLKASIVSGELKAGESILSESELSAKYGISRITVRNAISSLVEEGLLVKRQGKGTFVEKPKIERKIIEFLSFSTACAYNGMRPGSKLVKRLVRDSEEGERKELQLVEGDKVIHIQRLRFADGELLLLENNFFSYNNYSYLMEADLEHDSLYDILQKKHGVVLGGARKMLELTLAGDMEAKMLNIRRDSPLFRLKGIVYDGSGFPVHIALQLIRGDRYKFLF